MIADQDLYRISSWASWVALVALVIAAVTITLFFAGAGAFWGPLNDVFDVVVLVALAIIALGRGILPPSIGWLAVGFFVLSVAVVFVSALTLGPPLWIAAVALLLVMGGLFAALATTMASTADRLVTG